MEQDSKEIPLGRIHVDPVTMPQALDRIGKRVESGMAGYVLTPNVDHVVLAEDDVRLEAAYAGAFLSLADGMPVLWATRWLRHPLPEKVSGSDLVWPLLQYAEKRRWSVYLLGGQAKSAERVADRLAQELPGLTVVGVDVPYISPRADDREAEAAFERVREARPHLLLVGLGCPKQELWLYRYGPRLEGTVSLGVGASLDFLAGAVTRAPRWMSQAGLEWLFRLWQEPRRLWRRYLVRDPRFALIVLRMKRPRLAEAT